MTYALTILFALLQVGDWYTTRRVLANGGREVGPIMRQLIPALGLNVAFAVKGLVMVAGAVGVILLGRVIPEPAAAPAVILAAGCALYVWVCWHNWRQV